MWKEFSNARLHLILCARSDSFISSASLLQVGVTMLMRRYSCIKQKCGNAVWPEDQALLSLGESSLACLERECGKKEGISILWTRSGSMQRSFYHCFCSRVSLLKDPWVCLRLWWLSACDVFLATSFMAMEICGREARLLFVVLSTFTTLRRATMTVQSSMIPSSSSLQHRFASATCQVLG